MNNFFFRKRPFLRDYVVVANIGSGHYANTYKAYPKKSKMEVVAIKVFTHIKPRQEIRINQEVEFLRKLDHKNIVGFIRYLEEKRIRCIVMEYCDGGTLKELLKEHLKLTESLTRLLLQQLVNGLTYLSSKSICHMDLKPANILLMLNPPYCLKIADFGLSQEFTSSEIRFQRAGTLAYMAPEKLLKKPYGLISDLWSLGVLLRECLTGRRLFAGCTSEEIKGKINSNFQIEDPTRVQLTVHCKDLLRLLLKYDPNERLTLEGLNAHPFVDMIHQICPENYQKAKEIIKKALKCDDEYEYTQSILLYTEALEFLRAFANVEPNPIKKSILNMKIFEYERWVSILEKDPSQIHSPMVQPLPDINGPWYEIDEDHSRTSLIVQRDLDEPGTSAEIP